MDNQNPNGIFIDGKGLGGSQRAATIAHCVAANYKTISIMDDFSLASTLKAMLPDCVVVYRDSNFNPNTDYHMDEFSRYLSMLPDDQDVVLMVNCEAGFSKERVTQWCNMLDVAESKGWHLCVGNVSSGSVKCGQGNDPNEWYTIGLPLLQKLMQYPGSYLGVHEYTPFFPWIVSNVGDWGQPDKKPTKIDWTLYQYHIGRNAQGIMWAITSAAKTGIDLSGLLKREFMIITEGLLDSMDAGVMARYPGVKSDGWRLLGALWDKLFPGRDHEELLAEFHIWANEVVYQPLGFVAGTHTYMYNDYSRHWSQYLVGDAPGYIRVMEKYRYVPPVSVPVPVVNAPAPPKPPPAIPDGKTVSDSDLAAIYNNVGIARGAIDVIERLLKQ